MKIYTKTGDTGSTGLFGGQRVPKTDTRLQAYGAIDELNANLGLILALLDQKNDRLRTELIQVQNDLFVIGSHLATPYPETAVPAHLPKLNDQRIVAIEHSIDSMTNDLPPLKNFILPGGNQAGAQLHIARTICRRTERTIVTLQANNFVAPTILQYINRLSDWLFVAARWVNQQAQFVETTWSA